MPTRLFISALLLVVQLLEARLPDLIPYRKGDLWGYSDSTKKIVIEPAYEDAEFFEFGRAVVRKNGKLGVIDTSGKTVIPFLYKELEPALVSGFWRARLLGPKFGILDSTNKFSVPAIYEELQWCGGPYVVSRGLSEARIMTVYNNQVVHYASSPPDAFPVFAATRNVFIVQSSGKFGVINLDGIFVVPAEYDNITCHSCGYYLAEKSGKQVVIDKKGRKKRRLPRSCRTANANPASRFVPACSELLRDTLGIFSEEVVYVPDSGRAPRNCGWKYAGGSWAMMPKYEAAGYFSHGLATFTMEGKCGMVDTTFAEVIPANYEILFTVRPGFVMALRRSRVDFAKHPNLRLFLGYVDIHGTEYWEN